MYSCSSSIGLVSSKRKWQRPPNSWAIPKLSAIALEWPRWRYPFGSGGKRVTTSETLPSRTSAATISPMKSRRSGEAGAPALTRLLLVTSIRVVQYIAMSCCVGGSLEPLHHLVCHWIPGPTPWRPRPIVGLPSLFILILGSRAGGLRSTALGDFAVWSDRAAGSP